MLFGSAPGTVAAAAAPGTPATPAPRSGVGGVGGVGSGSPAPVCVTGMSALQYQQTLPRPVRSAALDRIQQQYGIGTTGTTGTTPAVRKYSSSDYLATPGPAI